MGEVDDTDRAADGNPSTAEVGLELIQTSATLVLVMQNRRTKLTKGNSAFNSDP